MIPIRDNIRAQRLPFVTLGLIGGNLAVFLSQVGMPEDALQAFLELHGVVPARFLWVFREGITAAMPGEVLTLLTSMFLHGGWGHVISNLWALWLFGDNVEDRLGHGRYAMFYLLCGGIAMLAHVLLNAGSDLPALGASGAIGGVMGAYLLFYPFARMIVLVPVLFYPLFVEIPAAIFLVIWFLSQVSGGTTQLLSRVHGMGGVAFWAHVGGFLAGMGLGRLWCRRRRNRRRCRLDVQDDRLF